LNSDLGRRVILAAACGCLILNCFLLLRPGSFGWQLGKALRDPNEVMHTISPVDNLYLDLAPDQNACVTFRNFGADNEHLAEVVYYRSCYAAYPRNVFAAFPGTVINHAKDFLSSPFEPNGDWLDQNRVVRRVDYEQRPDGNVKARVVSRELP
jgi:hypothetical protein